MEITINTAYGDVKLRTAYDCEYGQYYDALDSNDNFLGEIWSMPYIDEDDPASIEKVKDIIETYITDGDLKMP